MSVTRGLLVSLLQCLLGTAVALAQPVGPEFRVNTNTLGQQEEASVASDASGNFVVVWYGLGALGQGVFGQRYDSNGNPLGSEFQVNTYPFIRHNKPRVASDAGGNFVVVWNNYGRDGNGYGIFGQRFGSNGNPLGNEFQVNTYTTETQRDASVASDATGNFVVAWTSKYQDGDGWGVFGQRYDAGGNPLGSEFQVNTYTTVWQVGPAVASDASGNFVVVWRGDGQDGSYAGIFGQRYDSDGNALDAEFLVNTYTTGYQGVPSVASDAGGNFVVVWASILEGGNSDVFGQRYDAGGNRLGSEFRVNTFTPLGEGGPSVASDHSGNFVVVWYGSHDGGASGDGRNGIFGQRYDSGGKPLGGEFRVNTYTTLFQIQPSVASDSSGNFVVAWESFYQDGYGWGIFGQRFSATCEASVQVEGASQDVHTPGSPLPIRIHIAHNRPETVTVPWELILIDPWGRVVAERVTPPHTFEPGDVVDVELALRLPENLEVGTYTLRLGISGMAGTEGATTSFRVVGPSRLLKKA